MPRAGGSIFKELLSTKLGGGEEKARTWAMMGGMITSSRPVGDRIREMSAEPRGES